jgi:hypothetical protein
MLLTRMGNRFGSTPFLFGATFLISLVRLILLSHMLFLVLICTTLLNFGF